MSKLFLSIAVLTQTPLLIAQVPAVPTTQPAAAPDKVVMEVGDQKITARDYDNLVSTLPPRAQVDARGPNKRAMAEKLVEIKLLAAAAREEGLDKDPVIQTQLRLSREQVLAQAMAAKAGIDEAAVKAQYDSHKADYERVKLRHILVRTKGSSSPAVPGRPELSEDQAKAKANELRNRIVNQKQDFAAIATAESDDATSAAIGGELGTIVKGMREPSFDQAAFSLMPGEISQPVRTPAGYHIMLIEEHLYPTYEEVRERIEREQAPPKVEAFMKQLKETTRIWVDDTFFGPPTTAPAGGPPAH